jgi:hypothetical protein
LLMVLTALVVLVVVRLFGGQKYLVEGK